MTTRRFGLLLYRAVVLFYRTGCLSLSKGAAFSAFMSLFPVLTTLATLLVQARAVDVAEVLARFMTGVLPPGTESLVLDRFVSFGERPAKLLVVATILAVYAASGVMMSLMECFDRIYGIPQGRPFLKQRGYAALLVLIAALPAVSASAIIVFGVRFERLIYQSVREYPQAEELAGWVVIVGSILRYLVALGAVASVTGLLYHIGPNRKQHWTDVWPGAWLATLLWLIATALFAWYVRTIGAYNPMYGSIGAVLALLLWMYVLAIIAGYCCAFNAVREHQHK